VYIEVIRPNVDELMRDALQKMRGLANRLVTENPDRSLDLYLLDVSALLSADGICDFARNCTGNPDITHALPGVGFLRCNSFSPSLSPFEPVEATGPLRFVAVFQSTNTSRSRANLRIPVSDERAESLIRNESHHFSHEANNLLVMDVTSIPGGTKSWAPLIRRRFQPTINRRIGGIVLWDAVVQGSDVVNHVSVLPNPFARNALPQTLLDSLSGINDE
jgi:hypothetical protein